MEPRRRIRFDDRMELGKGMRVESRSSEDGYVGAWFEGVVVSVRKNSARCKIRFDNFVTSDGKPLVENVCLSDLRPTPPRRALPLHCSTGDVVEAYDTDCWWRGVVIKLLPCEEELWAVYLPDSCILKAYARSDLRPALEWLGEKWTVVNRERSPSIQQVIRSLTSGNSGQIPVSSLPNELKASAVSHGGQVSKKNLDFNMKPTAPAGDNSRICTANKKLKRQANVVPRRIQEDGSDNSRLSGEEDAGHDSRISGARKKVRLIADIVTRPLKEEAGDISRLSDEEDAIDDSRICGARKKLRRVANFVPHPKEEDSKTHGTRNGGRAFEHQKNDEFGPLVSPKKNSIKRVREGRDRKESPTCNEIQNPEAHRKSRRLNSSEPKRGEQKLKSRESSEACRKRSNNKRDHSGTAMENNCSKYDRNKIMRAAHKWELIVYHKLLWAFHTDGGSLTRERHNLLDALRLRLNITPVEHMIAMKEFVS